MTVTRAMLDWSRHQRAHLRTEMHLTPGGTIEAEVHSIERMRLEDSIRRQEMILHRARVALHVDRKSFARGLAIAHFNTTQEIKP